MTDIEKRAHDIAIAVMQENLKPVVENQNIDAYLADWINFYYAVYTSAKRKMSEQ